MLSYYKHNVSIQWKSDIFRYLGAQFSTSGRIVCKASKLTLRLEALRVAPLKPQQTLFFFANFLLQGVYHELIFSKMYAGTLRRLDILVRDFVRGILHLPKNLPIAAFHAEPNVAGFGIPSLRWIVSLQQLKRVPELVNLRLLKCDNLIFHTTISINNYFKNRLHT